MLDNISKQINADLQKEKDRKAFYDLIHEDVEFNDFIDNKILRLNENGVNDKMLKNEMPFLFIEDTVVDDELITNLQNEIDYEDNYEKKPITDSDETTDLQEPKDYDDDFSFQYASDADADTKLNKEVDYSDNQKTPVNIDEFSNEAAELLFEMGDILGAFEILEEAEADMTVPNVVCCPDEADTIEQAEEADVEDNEDPVLSDLDGVVMEEEEMDMEDLEESFFSLFESSDEDCDDEDDDCEEDDDDEDEEEEDKDDEKEDKEDDEEEEKDEKLEESFSILDLFS